MYELLLMKHRTSNTPDFLRALRSQIQVHLLKQIEVQGVSQADKLILKPKRAFILRKKSHEYGVFFVAPNLGSLYIFYFKCDHFVKPAHYSKSGRKNQSGMETAKWF